MVWSKPGPIWSKGGPIYDLYKKSKKKQKKKASLFFMFPSVFRVVRGCPGQKKKRKIKHPKKCFFRPGEPPGLAWAETKKKSNFIRKFSPELPAQPAGPDYGISVLRVLLSRKPEAGTGSRKPEARSRKPEARYPYMDIHICAFIYGHPYMCIHISVCEFFLSYVPTFVGLQARVDGIFEFCPLTAWC